MSITDKILRFRESVKPATLVAVSKTKPIDDLMEAYEAGQRHFGENKIQEMTEKWEAMPKDIHWHMIGHTQRNKVKYMAPYVHLIHGVDSPRLLKEINNQALKNKRIIDCLFQVHIAKETSKFGFERTELLEYLNSEAFTLLKNIRIKGLMGMATFTKNEELINREFSELKDFFTKIKFSDLIEKDNFTELSMGMTGDYKIALRQGSTIVRIGSAIFGTRNYN